MKEIYDRDLKNVIDTARDEGHAEGKEEGRAEGKVEGIEEGRLLEKELLALNLISMNMMTDDQVATATGLPSSLVTALRAKGE